MGWQGLSNVTAQDLSGVKSRDGRELSLQRFVERGPSVLGARQHDRQPFRPLCADDVLNPGQASIEDLAVQEQERG
jgi:hypothetical protein